ncbi:MAG: FKBP-type peptidyl-prolyl cis-trans isomerase [Chitinophagales bacterium]|nr:FKBP-type peptidyl-prolyl cis-trans isomerase [Chitinophagales bacterium]
MKKIFLAALVISFSFSSCTKNSGKCNFNDCAFKASNTEVQTIQNYLSMNSITATQHCSGLFYSVVDAGTGAKPDACSDVSVTYKGYLTNGNIFDQSTSPVPLSLPRTILGWRIGIPLVKAGGKLILYIPPSMGYGDQEMKDNNGNVVIPANSYLIFEITVVAVA